MNVRPWFTLYAKQLIKGPTNALNTPLGEYGCKANTQRNLQGVCTSDGTCGLIQYNKQNIINL